MYERWGKRGVDVVISVVSLMVLSPLMAIVALAIWLEDRHTPLFRQERAGQGSGRFTIMKFRTMPVNTAHEPSAALRAPVVSRTGRLLRRLNLDELPQLVNILRGDMSIVGPRPALPSQTVLIALRESAGATRAKPGLTGLAQIRSYDDMPDEVKAAHDAEYAKRITFVGDCVIIVKTLAYLTRQPPTY